MSFIPKNSFDWEYYLLKNPDIKKAGINTPEKCYNHWIITGRKEKRSVRKINKPVIKVSQPIKIVKTRINLDFKIAIMIHVFDINTIHCFMSYLKDITNIYEPSNFDIYFNICEEDNPAGSSLHEKVTELLPQNGELNIHVIYSPNRGGDIGGFIILCQQVINSNVDYKYAIFVHSKNKLKWRIDLCHAVFNLKFEELPHKLDIGLYCSSKWIQKFKTQSEDPVNFKHFSYHLIELQNIYQLDTSKSWTFVAGTMFLADIKIIKYIYDHQIEKVYNMLNRVDSIDINWLSIMKELNKNTLGTTNDYQYRLKYKHSLLSDFMIEHTYERIIGLICNHLNLKILGV